uniref:PAZ domain-containing protein n=1 Tax=Meloidogyne enterolobii TaxID=390850 RepID=A0A6V7UXQ9_MELEN|nr:unnamed protein product [Meloidogyne enterolobii]
MVRVIDEIARLLECSVLSLSGHLVNPQTRIKVMKEFLDRKVQTTYLNKDYQRKTFLFGGLTRKGANRIRAYGRLRSHYNVTISQHFYTRHRIRLRNPYLNCVIDRRPFEKDRFYPLEVLEFVDEEHMDKINRLAVEMGRLTLQEDKSKSESISSLGSPTIFMNKEDDDEIYRGDLSQDKW